MDFRTLTNFMDTVPYYGVPAASCLILKDNRPLFAYSVGYSDAAKTRPTSFSDIYRCYSVSKIFTVTAAMQLWERGLFDLDDPISRYLPEYAEMQVEEKDAQGVIHLVPAVRPITVRHLFTMTAGFNYTMRYAPAATAAATNGACPTREVIRRFAEEPLHFQPGTRYQYSYCHDVLGALIEVVSGQRLRDYMQEHIFTPCGLEDTCYALPAEKQHRLTQFYRLDPVACRAEPLPSVNDLIHGPEYDSGGAGILSTIGDIARFGSALLTGTSPDTGARLLRPETLALITTEQLSRGVTPGVPVAEPHLSYGLGVAVTPSNENPHKVGQFGWGGATGCKLFMNPREGIVYAFVMQVLKYASNPIMNPREQVLDKFYDMLLQNDGVE